MSSHGIASAPIRVVLSGGIGSGKSTVAELLEHRGWKVIPGDRLGHEVLEPDGEAFEAVARTWPEVVRDGRIDRGALATIVFSDPAQLERLEAITHPAIARRIAAAVGEAGDRPVAVEIPIIAGGLVDPSWTRVVVDAPREVRFARAVARGGDPGDVERRMASQPDRETWLRWADEVIDNTGDLAALEEEVDRLVERITTTPS